MHMHSTPTLVIMSSVWLSIILSYNYYKIPLINSLKPNEKYIIYPCNYTAVKCSPLSQESRSNKLWLTVHIFTAILDLVISWFFAASSGNPYLDHSWLNLATSISHNIFFLIIVFNLDKFGEFSTTTAIILNTTLLVAAFMCSLKDRSFNRWLYFFIISIAPGLEVVLYEIAITKKFLGL